jgi:hypothetical protein
MVHSLGSHSLHLHAPGSADSDGAHGDGRAGGEGEAGAHGKEEEFVA